MCDMNSAELWLRKKKHRRRSVWDFFTTQFYFEITWMVVFFSVNLTPNVVAHLGSVCGIMWKNWSGLPPRVLGVLLNLYFLLVTGLRLENAAVRVFSALNRNSYLLSPSHSV